MSQVTVGELAVDPLARPVHLAGRELALTRREFGLSTFLARHAGTVVSRHRLLTDVWREDCIDDQTIEVHVSALLRKPGCRRRAALPAHGARSGRQTGGTALRGPVSSPCAIRRRSRRRRVLRGKRFYVSAWRPDSPPR
ncbi:winged helix-turn-helix domain-containing protein [Streptomyces sp. H27-H1]|uniref:winged helix-turn-helix domain-containing protein n=1 Tax=Streptomyces sp. H27-H1 TaxID=2996461 RepID=UPI00226DE866|nr:winged helix-turn-helix domain-containing protein [Streptomyces sp. H27-H1]MCY0931967.1 winged helix-turn-helix domain-containing protein [Streptomyces sp. H27-H1]